MASFACRSGDTTAERLRGARDTTTRLPRGHRAERVLVERRARYLSFSASFALEYWRERIDNFLGVRKPHSDPLSSSLVLFIIFSSTRGNCITLFYIGMRIVVIFIRVKCVKMAESCVSHSETQQTFWKLLVTREYYRRCLPIAPGRNILVLRNSKWVLRRRNLKTQLYFYG